MLLAFLMTLPDIPTLKKFVKFFGIDYKNSSLGLFVNIVYIVYA